jgi:hypothetical protein
MEAAMYHDTSFINRYINGDAHVSWAQMSSAVIVGLSTLLALL